MSNVWENNIILIKADLLAHRIYQVTREFPRYEIYGLTSQIRRASLSVVLSCIEGYSRFKPKTHVQFLEIAFGSLKETHYLAQFCFQEKYIDQVTHNELSDLCNEIEKMLYSKIRTLKRSLH